MSRSEIALEAPRRRRRLGLWLIALGLTLIAAQSFWEWLLPYDVMALQRAQAVLGLDELQPQTMALAWGGVCALALLLLHRAPGGATALLAGVALGSSRLAAGGAAASLLVLLLTGVASLGWQSWRQGGLALLLGTALTIVAWDQALSSFSTLWPFCLGLVGMFVWIERQHIQATDQRLIAALDEREALIRDLDSKREQLTRLQQARTQLLASISHDLRQPLQAVRLYADALQARGLPAPLDVVLQRQLRAADDAVGMLDQFSEFSAIEQGALTSQPRVVEVREVLEAVAEHLRAGHAATALDVRVHGRPVHLWVDRSQFLRVVQNLAGNAVRHGLRAHAAAGTATRVLLGVRPYAGGCAIEVWDNGPGIPAESQALVFEPYVQLDNASGTRGGRGLGLTIVRGLVQSLGLQLAPLCSRVGQGTRFRVLAPAALRREAPEAAAAAGASADLRWLEGRMLAVLDDEEAALDALATALRAAGAHVVAAGRLEALRAQLDEELRFPDALVFDLDLRAEQDGLQAVALLREQWQTRTPAVIVTGRAGAQQPAALPPSCVLLPKPVALRELVTALAPLVAASAVEND